MEPPAARNLRALVRLDAVDVIGMEVRPASIPAGLGCRPGDFILDVEPELADRWIAAGLAQEHTGAIPLATREPE